MKLCALSVDVDEISFYHEIHGLPPPEPETANRVFDVGLGRLSDLAKGQGIPLTLFVIGSTLARHENGALLAELARGGCEIANHSFQHNYRMSRLDPGVFTRDIEAAQKAIAEAVGERPSGFRAPGYTIHDGMFDALRELGFAYDSSVFPCPAYYAAKAAAMGAIAARGRTSRSMLDSPNVLRAPTRPYRIGKPYWQRGTGLPELPVQVTRGLRLPFIGTFLCAGGPEVARAMTRMVLGEPLVNLELHGIDALDHKDGLDALGRHQRDLGLPHQRKLDALEAAISMLRAHGYAFVRLDEAARALVS